MAPLSASRRFVGHDKIAAHLGALKTQQYTDPPVRVLVPPVHRTIAWNASGTQIATGATDKTIRVWNPERKESRSQIKLDGHTHAVEKVLFNPVKEFELASCGDNTVRFWDTRSRTCTSRIDVGGDAFTLSWSVDGNVLVAGLKNENLIPISTTSTPTILSKHPQNLQTNQTCFSNAYPPQDLLVTRGDGSVSILDYPSFGALHGLSAHTSACTSIAYSPSGRYVAVGGSDAIISLWDTHDWVCRRTMSNPSTGNVRGLSWSWDGRYLVGASEEVSSGGGGGIGTGFEVYHAETGDVVYTVPTGTSSIPAVEWHPTRYWLAYTQIEEKSGKCALNIIGAAGGSAT